MKKMLCVMCATWCATYVLLFPAFASASDKDFLGKQKPHIGTIRTSLQTIECATRELAERFFVTASLNDRGAAAARFLNRIKDDHENCTWYSGPVSFEVRGIFAFVHNLDLRDILLHQYTTLVMVDALVYKENGERAPTIMVDVIRTPRMFRKKDARGMTLKEIDELP